MPWDFFVILVVLGVVVPWRGAARIRELLARPELNSGERLALYVSTATFQWLLTALVYWRCQFRGYTNLELGIGVPDVFRVAIAAGILSIVLTINQLASVRFLSRLPHEKRGFVAEFARRIMPHDANEILGFTALVATVAICEEFLYRGFVQAVFRDLAGPVVAIVISSVFFAVGHIYQGRRGLLATFVVGVLFALARQWTGSLAPSMIAHFATDFCAGIASWKWLMDPVQVASHDGAA